MQYPAGRKFARNRSISYGFRDIHTFSFSAKIQDGRQKWRKLKFFPFAWDTLAIPCGSKIRSKSLYLLRFSRYSHFFIFRKNPRWPPKVAKIEIFRLCMGHSCNTLRVKNSFEIALSLTVFEIFTLFHFPQKSKMAPKVAKIEIFRLCMGHSCNTLRVKNSFEIALSLTVFEIFTLFHFPQKSKMAAKSGEN